MHVPADLLLLAQWKVPEPRQSTKAWVCIVCMTCIAMSNTVWYALQWPVILHSWSRRIFAEECALWSIAHDAFIPVMHCYCQMLLHQASILVETFLIAIEKCLLSCLVCISQNNDSNVARLAGSFCKLFWLCSLSESSFMNINTCSCIESFKQQLSRHSNLHVCAEGSGRWSECLLHFSCCFHFLLLDTFVPGIWFLMFSSYFSRLSTMDVFPSMGRHILD